jgi:hypothetical protein
LDYDDGIAGLLYVIEFIEEYFEAAKFDRKRVVAFAE